jgi:hypothetical protein
VRLPSILLAALVAAGVAASPAAADSIVYAKQGNLYLTSPDGSKGYQLTYDGGYSSPSQAADGTIGALRNDQMVRLDRSGHLLSAVNGMGSGFSPNIGGPYEPRISPDGTRFAYYFYVQTSFDDYENDIRWIDTGSYTTWTYAGHFTSPATESEYDRSLEQPEWVANDRLLGTLGMYLNMWTWKLGTGHGYTYPAAQWWFGLQDPPDEWGVAAYHWYNDPSLSPDGSRLAMTDFGQQLVVADTHGPAWSGEPPYAEVDYVNPQSDLAAPTIRCRGPVGQTDNPSWARDGSVVAYGMPDGVHLMTMPGCTDRLLIPGGSEPAFGLADVNAAQAPAPPSGSGPAPAPAPAAGAGVLRLTAVSLHPRAFRARRGTTLRFTLSAPASVRLSASSVHRLLNGRAGRNAVRFKPRLRPGRYRLRLSAGPASATARFAVKR